MNYERPAGLLLFGIGTPVNTGTAGSILFVGSGGTVAQDNAQLFWDDTNNFLGLGTNTPAAKLHLSGNISKTAWTTNGILLRTDAATYTDTSSSGTVADMGVISIGTPTIAASSSTTYSIASTLRISNAPQAGSNVTLTAAYAIHVDNGDVRFDGGIAAGGFGTGATSPKYNIGIGHSLPAANWGVNGVALRLNTGTVTDTSSVDGATVATANIHSILRPTLAATNATTGITYTTAATLYIANSPTTSGLVTITNALALHVASGGVIFNGALGVGASVSANTELFQLNGNFSTTAWTTNGVRFRAVGRTYTDTSSSGTVTTQVIDSWGRPTIAASSATTYTHCATVYITNAPIAGSNVTITNPYALLIDDGDVRMDAKLIVHSGGSAPSAALGTGNLALSAAAWGVNGVGLRMTGNISTDTSSSGTVSNAVWSSFGTPTFAASNTTTYTNAASVYIQGPPTAGSNVTITSGYALFVDSGDVRMDGRLICNSNSNAPVAAFTVHSTAVSADAWGTSGIWARIVGGTATDATSSGTVTNVVGSSFGTPTFAASSSTTYTNAATLYVSASPTAGSNVTITSGYAIWSDAGVNRLDGNTMIGCTGTPLAQFSVAGSQAQKRTATATSYTILVTDLYIGVTSTAAARTITLPAASACFDSTNNVGMTFIVADESNAAATNNITLTRAGSDTFTGGATSQVINTNGGVLWVMAISTTQWKLI